MYGLNEEQQRIADIDDLIVEALPITGQRGVECAVAIPHTYFESA